MNIEVKLVFKLPAYQYAEEKHWALPEELIRSDPSNAPLSSLHQYDYETTGFSKITTPRSDTRQQDISWKSSHYQQARQTPSSNPLPLCHRRSLNIPCRRCPLLQSITQWPTELNLTNEECCFSPDNEGMVEPGLFLSVKRKVLQGERLP